LFRNHCPVDNAWGQPTKSEPCARQLLAVLEKQFRENSLPIVSVLKSQAHALRSLGRGEEAAKVELRIKTIQATP
jgi:hypothetical protein